MVDSGVRLDDNSVAGDSGLGTKLQILSQYRSCVIQTAKLLPNPERDQHAGGGDCHGVAGTVVLTLVILALNQ